MAPEDDLPPEKSRFILRLRGFELRAAWWELLDGIDARPRLKLGLRIGIPAAVLLGAGLTLARPWWRDRTFVRITREWIQMGRLDYAADEVRYAMEHQPESPATWTLAAELARARGDRAAAAAHSARAADLKPDDIEPARVAAADALLADKPAEARRLLERIPPARLEADPECLRLLGELARRDGDLGAARERMEAALRLAGPNPRDETTLGRLLLLFPDPVRREEGRTRLTTLAADPTWGAIALRALLIDAMERSDAAARLRLARLLREHPRCATEDVPVCLRAIAELAPADLPAELARLASAHRGSADLALRFVDWMNQLGRPRDALDFAAGLPAGFQRSPALLVGLAEAERLVGDWDGLAARAGAGDWGPEYEFLRLAYILEAARQRGETGRLPQLWTTLRARLAIEPLHSAYAAGLLYIWGLREEALSAAEIAAADPNAAVPALGLILRHHQLQRDANGQYQAFRRLAALRPDDADIANNFAYFSALLGRGLENARELATKNLERSPNDPGRRATLAFVELRRGDPAKALHLTGASIDWAGRDHALALPYGLALAALRRTEEARPILGKLLAEAETAEEETLIREALRTISPGGAGDESRPQKTP